MTAAEKRRYRLALKFAALFNSEFAYDIAHDAWEYYFKKTDQNLLSIPLKDEKGYLYTVIKKAFYRWYYKERKGYNPYNGIPYVYFPSDTLASPTDIEKDVHNRLVIDALRRSFLDRQVNKELAREIFDTLILAEGDQNLTARILDISKQRVQFYVNKLRNETSHHATTIHH